MALVEKDVIVRLILHPEAKSVDITIDKQIVDNVTLEVKGHNKFSRAYKIGVDDALLRTILGTDKANLIIANL